MQRDISWRICCWSPIACGRLTRHWSESSDRQGTDEFGRALYGRSLKADRAVIESAVVVAAKQGVVRAQVPFARVTKKVL